ncbi:MAG: DUF4097 family beta strand repeat-containing protein [Ruminiclostridium sp.]
MNKVRKTGAILCVLGVIVLAAGIFFQIYMSRSGYTGSVISESLSFENVRELTVISSTLPVEISYGDCNRVEISHTGFLPLVYSEDNGLLRLAQNDEFTLTLYSPKSREAGIKIILPHKKYERISVSSSSGSITAASLNAEVLELSTKSGNITAENLDERAKIRTESGKITASLSSLGGDMTINGGEGEVVLTVDENISFFLEFLTERGSFTSDIFEKKYDKRQGDAADLYNGGENLLRIYTTGGSLTLLK